MEWFVDLSPKAKKACRKLPDRVRAALYFLLDEIESQGPVRGNWPNYSKLSGARHHCHLKKGKPTYVAVWTVFEKHVRIDRATGRRKPYVEVEVIYVGTHEKAPY